jgi:hypothetical protein
LPFLFTPLALALTVACGGGGGGGTTPPAADFSLSDSPASTTIREAGSGSVSVTASRLNGETGAITLTLVTPPTGITGAGAVASGATSATFTFQVAQTVAAGTYPLTIQGTDGTATHTTPVSLVVTSLNSNTWQFDATASIPFFAVQDGTGAWTPVTGTGGAFPFFLTQAKGGVAYVQTDPTTGAAHVVLAFGSAQDLGSQDFRTVPASLNVTGTFSGMGATDAVDLYLGFEGWDHEKGAGTGQWAMSYLYSGLHDLIAVRSDLTSTPQAVIVHRGLNLSTSGDLGTPGLVDFSAEGATLVTGTLSVTGAALPANGLLQGWETLETDNGEAVLNGGLTSMTATASLPIYGVPAASLVANDRHAFAFQSGLDDGTGNIDAGNKLTQWTFKAAGTSLSLPAPADMTLPTLTAAATTSYARLRTQWAFDTLYNQTFNAQFVQGNLTWYLSLTPGYGSGDITLPDLSALAGWQSAWGLLKGTAVTGTFTALGHTWTTWPPADGAQTNQAIHTLTVTP